MNVPEFEIYIRFCETDAVGHVNNVSYFMYLEEARTRFFEFIEMDQLRQYSGRKLNFMVASAKCDYLNQAYARQRITVQTKVTRIGTKSFQLKQDIKNAKTGEHIATGGAVLVCFDFEAQKSVEIPFEIRSVLEQHLVKTVKI